MISTSPTSNMTCSKGVCAATAKTAILNVTDLQNYLATANLKVTTGTKTVDISVQTPVTWVSSNMLTLDSRQSIAIGAPVTITGPGGLALVTNDGSSGGRLSFSSKGYVKFWAVTNTLTINNESYTLVNSIASLAEAVTANPNGNYALANSYNASHDGVYTKTPVGRLNGAFEALGNTISNFSINDPNEDDAVAMIAYANTLNDLRMTAVNVQAAQNGSAAGIVATGYSLSGDFVSGKVATGSGASGRASGAGGLAGSAGFVVGCASTATVSGGSQSWVGGLLGAEEASGSIINSHASGTVTVASGQGGNLSLAGGLVGLSNATIENSYATGKVTGGTSSVAAGLVAQSQGQTQIIGSYATGAVTVSSGQYTFAGGLVGIDYGTISSNSHATGTVTGGDDTLAGGLVGELDTANISDSYSTGAVVGGSNAFVGGLVGSMDYISSITGSYSTGSATAGSNSYVGGLLGHDGESNKQAANISNTYSSGAVSGGSGSYVGGLVGAIVATDSDFPTIKTSYSTGTVTGTGARYLGAFIGGAEYGTGTIADDYWDTTTSGITNLSEGAGNVPNLPGITGLSSAQLQAGLPAGFDPGIWGESANVNGGLPYLLALPPG